MKKLNLKDRIDNIPDFPQKGIVFSGHYAFAFGSLGTALATAKLVEQLGGKVVALLFLNELSYLHPRKKLKGYKIISLVKFRN